MLSLENMYSFYAIFPDRGDLGGGFLRELRYFFGGETLWYGILFF